jgi:hypothetical protein
LFVNRIPTAVQLRRPIEYIEADERIAKEEAYMRKKELSSSITVEHAETKTV